MAIILQEALRGLFYVALARDAFAAEGVEIRFTSSPYPGETALRVMDGTVDVSWGGPYTCFYARCGKLAARRAAAPGAVDRPHGEVDGRQDRRGDRGLLHRCAAHDPCRGLHALQGARYLGSDADPAARRLRPVARRAGVRGFVSPGATFETAVDNTLAEEAIALRLPTLE